jgi:hypothetical protein
MRDLFLRDGTSQDQGQAANAANLQNSHVYPPGSGTFLFLDAVWPQYALD